MRAAADLHHVGVAENDVHALDRNMQQVGDHLRKARLVALAARLRADDHIDVPFAARTLMRACSLGAPIEDST